MTSFPFQFIDKGMPIPFKIEANSNFPGETEPVCILTNLGVPPAPDTFITVGPGIPPNEPDPWEVTFRWETVGGPAAGEWQLDAFLHSISGPGPNIPVPGFPVVIASVTPAKHEIVVPIGPAAVLIPAPGVFLYQALCDVALGADRLRRADCQGRRAGGGAADRVLQAGVEACLRGRPGGGPGSVVYRNGTRMCDPGARVAGLK